VVQFDRLLMVVSLWLGWTIGCLVLSKKKEAD
jgi:hypothetical protein